MWKYEWDNKGAIILKVRWKKPQKSKNFERFHQKWHFFGLRDLRKKLFLGLEYAKNALLKLDIQEII